MILQRLFPVAVVGLWLGLGLACGSQSASRQNVEPVKGKAFPVLDEDNFINNAFAHPDVWDGSSIAAEARIGVIRRNADGHIVMELEVGSPDTAIWAVWPTRGALDEFLEVGESVRIAGWLRRTDAWNQETANSVPGNYPLTLLAICVVELPGKEQHFDQKYLRYCDDWREGHLPPDMDKGSGK